MKNRISITAAALIIAYSALLSIVLPLRFSVDADQNLLGTHSILANGHYSIGYMTGDFYEIFVAILVQVTGQTVIATDYLSPLIGAVSFVLAVMFLARRFNVNDAWTGVALLLLASVPLIFARFRNTSHKAFTLFFILALVATMYGLISGKSKKYAVLWLFLFVGGSMTNIVFTGIAFIAITVGIFCQSPNSRNRNIGFVISGIPILGLIIVYLESISIVSAVSRVLYQISLMGTDPVASGGGGISGGGFITRIFAWETVQIGSVVISSWLVWSVGMFITGCLGAGSGLLALKTSLTDRTNAKAVFVTGIGVTYAGLFVVLTTLGDVSVAKRLVAVPLITAILYGLSRVSGLDRGGQRFIVAALLISCVLLAIATPRIAPTGEYSPHDRYVNKSELDVTNHANEYQMESANIPIEVNTAARKYYGVWVDSCRSQSETRQSVLYDSGLSLSSCSD